MAATVAALVLTAAGCGGGDEASGTTTDAATVTTAAPSTTAATATSRPAAEASFPVTIEHRRGSTTLDAAPERVATLGLQWTDVLLALDEQPIAHIAEALAGEGGTFPWQSALLDDSTGLRGQSVQDVPFEQIAALQPDLILVTYLAEDDATYDRLAEIAPTIGLLGDRQVDLWQDMIAVGGDIFGKTDRAAAIVADVDQLMADTAAEYPGLEGKSFSMANFVPGDQIYVVATKRMAPVTSSSSSA
jgi:iron complex transport system substrate-binding protein